MKEYIRKDVGDYFFDRTNDFEMSPPEHIWENIRKEITIPQATVKPHFIRFWQYYTISAIVGIIAISAYYYSNNSNNSNVIAENIAVTTQETTVNNILNESSSNTIVEAENKEEVPEIKSEIVKVKNEDAVIKNDYIAPVEKVVSNNSNTEKANVALNTKVSETQPSVIKSVKKYNISASAFENVKQILFVNNLGEKSIIVNNPNPNKFGFFEVDVTKLVSGRYEIRVVTDKEEIKHKIENF
ncbi:MAG: hypothetical protein A2033_17735 [Bacteroidetes bacterium GWA2_31_9]|nr:MAG: hypothetical protein A2033_17735 [Bacteroidetes bacterium GWA2_31_9]